MATVSLRQSIWFWIHWDFSVFTILFYSPCVWCIWSTLEVYLTWLNGCWMRLFITWMSVLAVVLCSLYLWWAASDSLLVWLCTLFIVLHNLRCLAVRLGTELYYSSLTEGCRNVSVMHAFVCDTCCADESVQNGFTFPSVLES